MNPASEPMPAVSHPMMRRLLFVVMLIPVVSFAAKALALLVHMINLPYYDDWRDFVRGYAGSFNPQTLFQPANDTLYPVGKVLDNLFIIALNSNVVAYQFLSMVIVLGSLMALQFHLLRKAIGNDYVVAASFVSTVLMLQPGSYWGLQYVAYHQAIPVVCILAILALVIRPATRWRLSLVAALTLIAGFAYISGAVAIVALALTLLLRFRIADPQLRANMLRTGSVVGAVGSVALVAQAWVIVFAQHGRIHRPDVSWIMPSDIDFWFYALGKIGRALGLSPHVPLVSLILTLTVVVIGVLASIYLLSCARHIDSCASEEDARQINRQDQFFLILTSLTAAIGSYLALIAAGRGGLRPDAVTGPLQVFAFGFLRFHFFWITVLIPWVLAAVLIAIGSLSRRASVIAGSCLSAIVLVLATGLNGTFSHGPYFEQTAQARTDDLRCIQRQINEGTDQIRCPAAYHGDLMQAYLKAIAVNASFTSYLPEPENLPFIPHGDQVLYSLTAKGARDLIRFVNAKATSSGGKEVVLAETDPQIIINIGEAAKECQTLQVTLTQSLEVESRVQIFYRPANTEIFSSVNSYSYNFPADRILSVSAILQSASGFGSLMRIDPSDESQIIEIKNIEVGCIFQS